MLELPPNIHRVWNPPNPFLTSHSEWIDAAPPAALEVYEERAKTVLNKITSPDLFNGFSVNPYRGCFHGCAYCFARPTHQYLGYGAGTDFERKIVVKINAPEQLRIDLRRGNPQRKTIMFSGVTDCYQPLEASYELTRRCLQVCCDYGIPVAIITKGALVRRDIDVFQGLRERSGIHVCVSIAFSDDTISEAIETSVARPSTRFRAMTELAKSGIGVTVGVAPVIPGLNDSHIPEILKRAKECGAERAFMVPLRLPAEVKDVFLTRLQATFPDRYKKIVHQIRLMRGGALYQPEFGKRMCGEGPRWEAIQFLFRNSCQSFGLNCPSSPEELDSGAEISAEAQLSLLL